MENATAPDIGETDLTKVLCSMEPVLEDGVFVFVSLPDVTLTDPQVVELQPKGLFLEREGLSLIVREERAYEKGHRCDERMRLISLTAHSALSMCGLTATISARLASLGISCNVVAAYHHDHIFVDATRADDAMQALKELSAEAAADEHFHVHATYMVSGDEAAAVTVRGSDTVLQLKAAIEASSGIPTAQQRLFCGVGGGCELLDAVKIQWTPLRTSPSVLLVTRIVEDALRQESIASYAGESVAEAAHLGALGDVIRLVEAGADINSVYWYGYTALHHMAAVPFDGEGPGHRMKPEVAAGMMRWLLEKGADVNKGDNGGKTPLHVIGKYGGHMDQLRALLDEGADVNRPMNYGQGWTPLWYVRNYRLPLWRDFEATLLEQGARQVPDELE